MAAVLAPQIAVRSFQETWFETTVNIQVTWLTDSLFVWVSASDLLKTLAVATPSQWMPEPASSTLLFGGLDDASERLASILAKRTKKQVFVSCTLPGNDIDPILPQVIKRILAELEIGPTAPSS